MKIKQLAIDYHRNGSSGTGFYVVLFAWRDTETIPTRTRRMVATVFPTQGHVSVLDIDATAAGDLDFPKNRWQGDNFEPALRQLIAAYEA